MNAALTQAHHIVALSCFLLGVALAGAALWVGRRLWRKSSLAFGPEGLRLVGFLVAAVFFLPLIVPTIRSTLSLAFTLLVQVPSDFAQKNALAPTLTQAHASQNEGDTLAQLPNTFASIAGDYSDAIVQHAQSGNHPPIEIAYFLLLWMVLGRCLAFCFTPHKEDSSNRFEAIAEYLHAKKNSLAIFLLLGFGLYLSLASIAGITELSEKPPTDSADIKPSRLDGELAQIQLTEERLTRFYPVNILDAPPTSVQLLITAEAGTAGQPARPPAPAESKPEILASYDRVDPPPPPPVTASPPPTGTPRAEIQPLIVEREKLRAVWSELRQRVLLEQQDARTLAYTVFEVDSFPKPGFRERAEHFIGIKRWYQGRSEQLDSALKECKGFIFVADKLWQQWALDIVANSYSSPQESKNAAAFASVLELAPKRCALPSRLSELPARNDPGSRLGPISLIASWIIKSESVPLALIVGMMGFGLLGSVVSSFIRNQGVHQERSSLHVPDLVGIVLRGFSAAVVVFLAVQGGISIFFANQEKANLNPYVVLLACLVASVYSEDAWRVARRRLTPDADKPVPPLEREAPAVSEEDNPRK